MCQVRSDLLCLLRLAVVFRLFRQPALAHLHRPLPPLEHLLARHFIHLRLKHRLPFCVDFLQLVERLPDIYGEAGGDRSSQGGGLPHLRPDDWNAHQVGLRLHAECGIAHSAIHLQLGKLVAAVELHGIEDGLGLEADGFQRGARNVAALGVVRNTNCRTRGQ